MAAHLYYNKNTEYAQILTNVLRLIEQADEKLDDLRDVMIQMRESDGSQDVHYALIKSRFGFETDADARAAFALVDDVYQRVTTNASVTNVKQTRNLFMSRLR